MSTDYLVHGAAMADPSQPTKWQVHRGGQGVYIKPSTATAQTGTFFVPLQIIPGLKVTQLIIDSVTGANAAITKIELFTAEIQGSAWTVDQPSELARLASSSPVKFPISNMTAARPLAIGITVAFGSSGHPFRLLGAGVTLGP